MSSTSLLNTLTLSEFVDLTRKQFSHVNQMVEPAAAQLFIYEDLTSWSSNQKRYDEIDTQTFAHNKGEGENAIKSRAGVGYNKTMTAKRIATEIDITWEMRRYGQEHKIKKELYTLNHFVPQRVELDLTHRLTFGTATSYTDLDGEVVDLTMGDATVALFSTAHALKYSATTWSNRLSGDPAFSQGALEAAEDLYTTDILSNFGERRVIKPNVIWSTDTASVMNDIKQVLNSTSDVDAAHAGVKNVNYQKYTYVVLPYLATSATGARDATKKRWWGLASVGMNGGFEAYYGVFEKPNLKTPVAVGGAGNEMFIGEDIHNDNQTFGVRESHGICILTGKGIVASCPTN
jgi:hypothetical protein